MSIQLESGDLNETPLAALLVEAHRRKATGVLTIQHATGLSKVFLRDGDPAGAQVFVGFRPLGHFLLGQGVIDIETLEKSLSAMSESKRLQGEVLVEMGAITQAQLDRALVEQQMMYLGQLVVLGGTSYNFETSGLPRWTEGLRISTPRVLVDALEAPIAEQLVSRLLGTPGQIKLTAGYDPIREQFAWNEEEALAVEKLRAPMNVDNFISETGFSAERARAIIAALLLLELANLAPLSRSDPVEAQERRRRMLHRGLQNMGVGPLAGRNPGSAPVSPPPAPVKPAPSPEKQVAPPVAAAKQAPETPEMLRAAVEHAILRAKQKNYFERLGLVHGAKRDEVKKAFYAIAKRFHPDRFTGGEFADLLPKVRDFFAAVNEAYETLGNEKKRSDYIDRMSRR